MKIKFPNTKDGIKKFLEIKKKIILTNSNPYDIMLVQQLKGK